MSLDLKKAGPYLHRDQRSGTYYVRRTYRGGGIPDLFKSTRETTLRAARDAAHIDVCKTGAK